MVRGVSFFAAALAVACQFPKPADRDPDASPDAPADAPVDAPPDRVAGRFFWVHATEAEPVEVPIDLSTTSVSVLVPEDGELRPIIGVGRADGTYQVDGVPPDVAFFIKVGRDPDWTSARNLTDRSILQYRHDAAMATQPTPVTFNGELPAYASGDVLDVRSHLAQVEHSLLLTPGDTSFSATVDWQAITAQRSLLPVAARGDDLSIVQLRTTPASDVNGPEVQQVLAAAILDGQTIVNGSPITVDATLTAPTASFNFGTSINRDLLEDANTFSARPAGITVTCAAVPSLVSRRGGPRIFLPIVRVAKFNWRETDVRTLSVTGTFPDPYRPSWPRMCRLDYSRNRAFRYRDGSIGRFSASGSRYSIPNLLDRALPPPRDVRIDGRDLDWGGLLTANARHELTWVGSAAANSYEITIFSHLPGGLRRYHIIIATAQPSLTIYPEFLAGVERVSIEVRAISAPSDFAAGEHTPWGVPTSEASFLSALFRVSSTCGDGQLDVGEDCDARGESATCDVDCTAVTCGDGLRNPTAGELCDPVEDAVNCDADCTPAVCGDGYRNTATEACDDGGTAPGDGCSPTCRVES
jgi:cysteine-rich repeat protein